MRQCYTRQTGKPGALYSARESRSATSLLLVGIFTFALTSVTQGQDGTGDFDNNCAVDLNDFGAFAQCLDGPEAGLSQSDCWRGDMDADVDVDLRDFAEFQVAFASDFADQVGACCLPDDSCVQLTCSSCIGGGGLFVAPGAVSCDIAVCCQADLRTDSDNDGDIDDDDEAVEDIPPGVVFPVNSDDDNGNGVPDMDEAPVSGEDDLVEVQLSSSCDPSDPGSAWWSLSWPIAEPALLQVWEDPEKTTDLIENDLPYAWPPSSSLWVEALETFELDLTFTVSVDDTRAQKKDKVKATVTCTPGKKYVSVSKSGSATGCSAKIRTRSPGLCGEPNAKTASGSSPWAGVTRFESGSPVKWAQCGYVRYRAATGQSSTVYFKRYAETRAGPNPADYDIHLDTAPATGAFEYKCYLTSSLFGTWNYEYDGLPWYQYTHNGWRNVTGTHYQWQGEIDNKEDQMVGTSTAKCDFTECQYSVNWGAFQNANITTGDLHTDDASEWGIERVSATAFNVWDKNP